MRFSDDGLHFLHRHLILIDQLDDVHAGIGQLFYFRPGVGGAFNAPAESFRAGIGLVLNKRPRDIERRAGKLAAIDPVAHLDAFLQRRAEIARAGYAGHEQLMRGRRHDLASETLGISFVPMVVVAVAEQHGVNVAIPKAGQNRHAFGGNDFGIRRDLEGVDRADGGDALAFDHDHAVGERRPAEAVDQTTADQRDRSRR